MEFKDILEKFCDIEGDHLPVSTMNDLILIISIAQWLSTATFLFVN